MKDVSDLIAWAMGVLVAIITFGWRYDKSVTNDKLRALSEKQMEGVGRLSVVEEKVSNIEKHHTQTLEDIKSQVGKTAEDVTTIKIAIASIPKRKED